IVTTSYDRTTRIWDAATGEQIALLDGHGHSVTHAAFSRDGSRIVTASVDQTARIWDAATGKEIEGLGGPWRGVNSATFSPDGSRVVTASGDNTARVWNAAPGYEIGVLGEKKGGGSCGGSTAAGGLPVRHHPHAGLQPRRVADRHRGP